LPPQPAISSSPEIPAAAAPLIARVDGRHSLSEIFAAAGADQQQGYHQRAKQAHTRSRRPLCPSLLLT